MIAVSEKLTEQMTKDGAVFNVPLQLVDEWAKAGWSIIGETAKPAEKPQAKKVTRKPKED